MKYIIELEKIEGTDLYRAKGTSTMVFNEWDIEYVLKPMPEPESEVDWTKVKVDTPILVSKDNKTWEKRHFAKYEDDKVCTWTDGKTSFTAANKYCYIRWDYAKLAEVEE